MMRWTPNTTTETTADRDAVAVQGLIDTVVGVVARMGTQSVLLAVTIALIVATVVFGLSTGDALAGGRWCPSC